MSLLTLKGIGKIYVSEGNVVVGIRGVDLSFDRGEFVAVTGASGSGKSTLLNVISGMDTYEEGELLIEGQPTSHYLQPEWEEYRKRYISFIFQDYNIIESCTVLQNVELALMNIEDRRERRRRALELLDRVGMSGHLHQKGSKLSGGQKQRTVIARALAKDSPIILADEPTGNLDSATAAEIVTLLREVSRDKLLIVVTHNFEEVEHCATRHIRVFDGAIESDTRLSPSAERTPAENPSDTEKPVAVPAKNETKKKRRGSDLRNGLMLGRTMFTAKPKLSFFLCLLMLAGTLGIFLVTSLCGDAASLFDKHYMFEHFDGRLILAKRTGEVITDEELAEIASRYGSDVHILHYDQMLDENNGKWFYSNTLDAYIEAEFAPSFLCESICGTPSVGRYPAASDEIMFYLPISYRDSYTEEALETARITINDLRYRVVGVSFYYDNNITPRAFLTEEGFQTATANHYLFSGSVQISLVQTRGDEVLNTWYTSQCGPSFDIEGKKAAICNDEMLAGLKKEEGSVMSAVFSAIYNTYYYSYGEVNTYVFERQIGSDEILCGRPASANAANPLGGNYADILRSDSADILLSVSLMNEIAEEVLARSYRQASLFFANDAEAHAVAKELSETYIAVPSDTDYEPPVYETILNTVACLAIAVMWILTILFLAFLINLCSTRSVEATKGDLAIMRSMGIPVRVIRIGMYVRMLLTLIPAYIIVIVCAVLIFTIPAVNALFTYLYAWQYALIFIGMLLLTLRVTHKQIRKIFGESVRKSLRGGAAE